jgi:hypothetical protein
LRQLTFYEAIEVLPPVVPPMLGLQDHGPEVLRNLFGLADGYSIAPLSPVLDHGL